MIVFLRRLVGYLLNGSDALYLSKGWRETHMVQHEAWTLRQLDQGSITRDVASFRREAFWAAREQPVSGKVIRLVHGKRA